jgi:hypothetical protein
LPREIQKPRKPIKYEKKTQSRTETPHITRCQPALRGSMAKSVCEYMYNEKTRIRSAKKSNEEKDGRAL